MSVRQILVLGGGFAGLWSALGAARKLDELDQGTDAVEVTLVNRDAFHSIRVRNYEADLTSVRIPLDDVGVRGLIPRNIIKGSSKRLLYASIGGTCKNTIGGTRWENSWISFR